MDDDINVGLLLAVAHELCSGSEPVISNDTALDAIVAGIILSPDRAILKIALRMFRYPGDGLLMITIVDYVYPDLALYISAFPHQIGHIRNAKFEYTRNTYDINDPAIIAVIAADCRVLVKEATNGHCVLF